MKTCLRYGQPLDKDGNKVVGNERWTAPDNLLSDIFDKFKNVAEADMEIYRVEEKGVIRVKITDTTKKSLIYAIIEVASNVIKWIIDNTRLIVQLVGSSEAAFKKEVEEGPATVVVEEHSEEGFAVVDIEK